MKKFFLLCTLIWSGIVFGQNDTLLYVGFDSAATSGPTINVPVTNTLDINGWGNVSYATKSLASEVVDAGSDWYDANDWRKWHKIPYIDAIDTTVLTDTVIYDTTANIGFRSFSWFTTPDDAYSLLLSPPVWLSPGDSKLQWRSMPIQGPRYQDGYNVYVLAGNWNALEDIDPDDYTPDFTMQEMNSSPAPNQTDSSLYSLQQIQGFSPISGTQHTIYSLPEATGSGLVDSSRQHPFMQTFEIDLSQRSGFVQILFYHNSHDDVGIIIDDILVTGTGSVGTQDLDAIEVALYPNPASDHLNIQAKVAIESIRIYNLEGRLMNGSFQINDNTALLETANLPAGIYHVEIWTAQGRTVQPFLVR